MATGGSIESVTLAGRRFPVAADNEVQRKLGGFENELQSNGDGSQREIKTRTAWELTGVQLSIEDDRGDDEYLTDLQNSVGYFSVTVTYVSGVTYGGQGQIVGEPQASSQNATKQLDLSGPGRLERID